MTRDSPARPGAFAALALPLFRILWLAEFAGDLGNWIQTVGAQWVIVHRADAVLLAAAVLAAGRAPMLLFALPMGAVADLLDRRRLLLAGQVFQAVVAAVVTGLSATGRLGAPALIVLTFLLGTGSALSVVAFQALTPQVVPAAQLPSAVAVAQVNLNLARVVGPPVGGLLVAVWGPTAVFALDTVSYLVFVAVLLTRAIPAVPRTGRPRLPGARAFLRSSVQVRRVLAHTLLLTLPSSALWALLPSSTVQRLHLGALGYGLLLAAVGAGSIAAVALVPTMYRRRSLNSWLLGAGLLTAAALGVLGGTGDAIVAAVALFGFGAAWLAVQTLLGTTMQLACPDEVRARMIGLFQGIRIGGQGVGALLWGVVAQRCGLSAATLLAAAAMAAAALVLVRLPVPDRPPDQSA